MAHGGFKAGWYCLGAQKKRGRRGLVFVSLSKIKFKNSFKRHRCLFRRCLVAGCCHVHGRQNRVDDHGGHGSSGAQWRGWEKRLGKAAGKSGSGLHQLNHLAREKSPYLIQHVRNSVDWYPWGQAAFAKARPARRR